MIKLLMADICCDNIHTVIQNHKHPKFQFSAKECTELWFLKQLVLRSKDKYADEDQNDEIKAKNQKSTE